MNNDLKTFLEENHMSQNSFSKFSGIPQSTLSYFINGKSKTPKTGKRIGDAIVNWYSINAIKQTTQKINEMLNENDSILDEVFKSTRLPWWKRLFHLLFK